MHVVGPGPRRAPALGHQPDLSASKLRLHLADALSSPVCRAGEGQALSPAGPAWSKSGGKHGAQVRSD